MRNLTHRPLSFAIVFFLCFLYLLLTPGQAQQSFRNIDLSSIQTNYEDDKANNISYDQWQKQEKPDESGSMKEDRKLEQQKGPDQLITKSEDLGERQNQNDLQQQIERLQKQLQMKRERLQKRSQTTKQQSQSATATAENTDNVQGNSDGSIQVVTNQLTIDQYNQKDNQKNAPLQDKSSEEIDEQEVSQNTQELSLKDKNDLAAQEVDKSQGNTGELPSHNMQGADDASIQSKTSQKSNEQQTTTHIDALTKNNDNLLANPDMESQESNIETGKNDSKDEPDNNKIPEDTNDAKKNIKEGGKLIQDDSDAQQLQNTDGNKQIEAKDKPQNTEEEMTDKQNPNAKRDDLSGTKPEINQPIDYRPQIDYEPARLINPQHPSNKTAPQTQQTVNPQDILTHPSDGKNPDNNLNSTEIPNSGDKDTKSSNENNKNSEIHEVESSDQGSKEDSQMNVPVGDSQKGQQLQQTNEEMKQNQGQQTENKESDELKRPEETSSRNDKYFDSIPTPQIIDNDVPTTPKIKDDSPTSTNDLLQNPVADVVEGKNKINQTDPQVQTNTKQHDLNQQERLKPKQSQSQKEISDPSQQEIRIEEGQNEKESIKKKQLEGRIIRLEQQLKMLNQHPASEQSSQDLRKEAQDNPGENDSGLKVQNLEQRLQTALQKLSEIQNKITSQNPSPTPSIQDEVTAKLSQLENKLGQLQSQHSKRQSMGQPFQGKADQGLSKGHDDRDSFEERQNQKDREIQRLKANVDSLNNKLNTLESLIHQTARNSMQTAKDDAETTKINQRDGSIRRDIPTDHKDQSTNEHNIIVQQINNSVETPEQREIQQKEIEQKGIEQKGDVIKNDKNNDSQVQQQNTSNINSGATNRKQQQRQNEQESIESPASQQKDENIKTKNEKQSIEQQKKLEEPRQIKETDKFGQQDQFSQQQEKSNQQKLENTDSQSKGLASQESTAPTQQNQKTIKDRDSRQGNLKKDDKRSKDQEQAQIEDKKELSTDHLSSELQSESASQTIDEQPKSLSKDHSESKGSLKKEDSQYKPEQLQQEQKQQELEKPKSQKIANKKDSSSFLLGISFNQFILYSSLGAAVLLILKKFFKDNTNSLHATQSPRSALSIDASIQQFQENRQPQSTVDKLKKRKYVDIDNDQPSSERRMQRQQLNEQSQIASPYDVDSQSFPNQQLSTTPQIEPINFKDNLTQRPKLIKPIQKPVSKTSLQKFNRVAIPPEFTQAQQIINFLDNRNPLQSQISINPNPVNKPEEGVLQIQPSVVSKIVPQNETIYRPFVLNQNYQDSTYENTTIDKSQMNLNNDDQFLEFSQATRNNELEVVQKPQMEIQVDNQSVLHHFEIPNIVDNQTYASRSPSTSPGIIKQSHALEITGQSQYNNREVFRPAEKPVLMPYQEDEQFEDFQQSSTSHPNDQPALHQDPSSEQFQEGQIISIVRDSFEQPIIQSLSVQPSQSLQQDSTIIDNVNQRTPNIEIITNNKNEEDDPFSHLE